MLYLTLEKANTKLSRRKKGRCSVDFNISNKILRMGHVILACSESHVILYMNIKSYLLN